MSDLAPPIPEIRLRLTLTRLVEAFLRQEPGFASPAAAPGLADALASLLDELSEEGLGPDALKVAADGEFSEHWEKTLRFVQIIAAWRSGEAGAGPDPKQRQRAAVSAMIASWEQAPPGPVFVAGSTGSLSSTRLLLQAVAALPNGGVVLPGFDPGLPDAIWDALTEEHPMAPFRPLLDALGARPRDVALWEGAGTDAPRLALLTEALRPAPVTDGWRIAAPRLASKAEDATTALTLVEADNPRAEAGAIALAVRRALETPEKQIAVVTADGALARRVSAELARFGIAPDDSLGQPLAASPAGLFFRLVLEAAEGGGPVTACALLKHPFAQIGGDRARHLDCARRYDLALRAAGPVAGGSHALPPWPEAEPDDHAWLEAAEAAIQILAERLGAADLGSLIAAHREAAEALAGEGLWQAEDGDALAARLDEIALHASAYGTGHVSDYRTLLNRLLDGVQLRPRSGERHPRVAIWGTAEARIARTDMMILAGLNEGSWPALPAADPWLSRPMRQAAGLPSPERQLALSAHDFFGAAAAGEVILTRSTRAEGADTVAARWLIRLQNLLGGTAPDALAAMRARGGELIGLLDHVHRPDAPEPRAARPSPKPPRAARPMALSISRVEELVRDPYAIYAREILALKPLDPLGRRADARERGSLIHRVLERFVERTRTGLPPEDEREALYDAVAAETIAEAGLEPSLALLWRARLDRGRAGFLAWEAERRAEGRPLLTEAVARHSTPTRFGPFTLNGRIDRIDALGRGQVALYDYKSGTLPSRKQISLFNLQLDLGAWLLSEGGVAGIGRVEPVRAAYVGLGKGGKAPETELDPEGGLARHAAMTGEKLVRFVEGWGEAWRGYTSRARVETLDEARDFDHLARRAEWEEGG